MRGIIISIICLISFENLLLSQTSGYSIGIAADRAGGVIKSSFGTSGRVESHNYYASYEQAKPVLASLGKGYDFQISIFKAFKRNIGLGLGTNFHKGSPVTMD